MAFYLNRLASLQQSVASAFEQHQAYDHSQWSTDTFQQLRERLEQQGQGSGDLVGDLEVVFKTLSAQFAGSLESESDVTQTSAIRFIKFSIDFALAHQSVGDNFPKIPFLLIEDLLEYQTISQAKRIWTVIESLVEKITNPILFNKGKLVVLKTSNSILRKLSKSCDTEFCGRILMFLAAVYPLSELSALNLSGRINVTNQTYYDTLEQYQEYFNSVTSIDMVDDSAMDIATTSTSPTSSSNKGSSASNPHFQVTYDLYESFWKLQSYFASNAKPFEPLSYWNEFMTLAKKTIEMFEQSQVVSDFKAPSSSHHNNNNHNNGNNNQHEDQYQGNKYLTSSQLFALQIQDPFLRQQFALQLWMFAHYLQAKILAPMAEGKQKEPLVKDVQYLHEEAKRIIEKTSSNNSEQLLDMIQQILQREDIWIHWKNKNCPTFIRSKVGEKRKAEDVEGGISMDGDETSQVKTPKTTKPDIISMMRQKRDAFVFDYSDANVKEISKQLADSCPMLDNLVEEYLEADDPDAGIEEEYHPKNDHLYCWRTRRLLAEKKLSVFQVMPNGDLGKGIRKLRGIPEPAPKPEVIVIDDEMNASENNKDDAGSSNNDDRVIVDLTLPPKKEVIDIDILMEEVERGAHYDSHSSNTPMTTGKSTPKRGGGGSGSGEPEDGEEVEVVE